MAVAGFGILFYTSGAFFYGFAPFFDKILDEFGWPAGLASVAFAFQRMEQGIFGPFVGYIADRFGPRRSLLGGLFVLGLGFIALSFIQDIWHFFGAFALMALGLGFGSFLTVNTAVNAWFVRKRGKAMAIVSYGAGVSSLLVPIIVGLIAFFDWREALLYLGFATWVVGLPLALIMRDTPEKYGLRPDGATDEEEAEWAASAIDGRYTDTAFTVREAVRTTAYWKYVIASMFGFVFFSAFIIHQFVAWKSFGLTEWWAAALVTLMPLASFPGRIVGGVLADMYDKRKIVAVSWTMQTIGAVILFFVSDPITGIIFAIFFGFGFGIGNPPRSALLGELFGRQVYGTLLGIQFSATSLGGIIAPVYAGTMYDNFGAMGYRIAFLSLGLLAVISLYLYLTMKRPQTPDRIARTYVRPSEASR